jgi:hypothetical protein
VKPGAVLVGVPGLPEIPSLLILPELPDALTVIKYIYDFEVTKKQRKNHGRDRGI